ncbi:MAG: PIN domain nuclease, partial [Nitrospirae bacterium]|nr:PIN domain nuclease [Nitrospirota bacterium]
LPVLSSRRNLPLDKLFLALSLLPLVICDEEFYKNELKKATKLIGGRDPDDAHLLALSLKLNCPIWSNDKDFEQLGVDVYTTSALIEFFTNT